MELVGVPYQRPGVPRRVLDCFGVQGCEVALVLGQRPPKGHGPRPPLLYLAVVVEKRVRHGVQYLVAEGRRLHRVLREHLDVTVLDRGQHVVEALDVHRFRQAVAQCLEHDRMVRHLDVARRSVVLAGDLGREHRGQQVVGAHALQRRRHLLAPREPQQRQRSRRIPAPANPKQRRLKHGLGQRFLGLARLDVSVDVGERERH